MQRGREAGKKNEKMRADLKERSLVDGPRLSENDSDVQFSPHKDVFSFLFLKGQSSKKDQ